MNHSIRLRFKSPAGRSWGRNGFFVAVGSTIRVDEGDVHDDQSPPRVVIDIEGSRSINGMRAPISISLSPADVLELAETLRQETMDYIGSKGGGVSARAYDICACGDRLQGGVCGRGDSCPEQEENEPQQTARAPRPEGFYPGEKPRVPNALEFEPE